MDDSEDSQASQGSQGLEQATHRQEKQFSSGKQGSKTLYTKAVQHNDIYNFTNDKRGIAIIIVNDRYQGANKREGCEKDMQALQFTFANYGFEIRCFKDKNAGDILKEIKNISKEDHSRSDCLAIAITTHGESMEDNGVRDDFIYASDTWIKTKVILEQFTDLKCPTLKGKPRLVFIQACRGEKLDEGVDVKYKVTSSDSSSEILDLTDSIHMHPVADVTDAMLDKMEESTSQQFDNSDSQEESTQGSSINKNSNLKLKSRAEGNPGPCNPQPLNKPSVNPAPCYKDFLVMYATPPGYFAFRRVTDGSWFIKCLCDTLSKQIETHENLLKVLTKVVSEVSFKMQSKNEDATLDAKKQSPVIYSRLTKDLYLTRKK